MNAPREQMELTLESNSRSPRPASSAPPHPPRRSRRYVVSRWWFDRMREAVREAQDWNLSEIPR